jgi:hypothetical protein
MSEISDYLASMALNLHLTNLPSLIHFVRLP